MRKGGKVSHFAFAMRRQRQDWDDAGSEAREDQDKKSRRIRKLNQNTVSITQPELAEAHGQSIRVPVEVLIC